MNLPQINDIITLTIHNIGNNGEGVGSHEGFTVFVEGALPGEIAEVRLFECHKRYGHARLIKILKASPDRVDPPCSLFGKCGGCQLMHLSYPKQLSIKQQRVIDALQRIAKVTDVPVEPCLPSPSPLGYRNKIQFPVRDGKNGLTLGLYARASHDLIEVDHCHIHCPLGESIYQQIKPLIKASGIQAYNPSTGEGELRHVLIKSAVHRNESLVILVTKSDNSKILPILSKDIMSNCSFVKGVVQNIQPESDNVILGRTYKILAGQGFITEQLGGMTFKVSPASFFQVNPDQAECLYAKALELAQLTGNETVLDAYCGVGTLALFFAKHAKKVIGVECIDTAIEDAKENAVLNNILNASFVCANAETYIRKLSKIDVAILNPPRKGCDPLVLSSLKQLKPKSIIYVSCDPATLARDIALLHLYGYKLEKIQPYDMFPQTAHVECVAQLTLK